MRRSIFGTLSFFEQWAGEVVRQPTLMFTLVVAPFLLLFAFGAGVELGGPRPRTVVVQEPGTERVLEPYLAELEQHLDFRGFVESTPLARRALERGEIDAVIVSPGDLDSFVDTGQRIPLRVLIGEVDPVRRSYARSYLRDQVAAINQRTIARVVGDAQAGAGDVGALTADARRYVDLLDDARGELETARSQVGDLQAALGPLSRAVDEASTTAERFASVVPGLSEAAEQATRLREAVDALEQTVDRMAVRLDGFGEGGLPTDEDIEGIRTALDDIESVAGPVFSLDPAVISAPFELQLEDVTPIDPTYTAFYSPGVVALLVQHLAITLGALTLSRMRLLRVTEMLRVAPIRAGEVVAGNYLAYGTLCAVVAAALVALAVFVLDVPVSGSWAVVAGTLGLLIACSLGIGFVISLVSASAQQATQVAMLFLLGSIFFSGFVFPLDRMQAPVDSAAYLFPATFALRTLQDVMLRGVLRAPEDLVVLGVAALVLMALATVLMRRELRAA
ncbi:MAG: ABC transporter permease [Dehalococcoidia bacterium]|nr:ABC transporter permease [Dehalococcoidia bacterium]